MLNVKKVTASALFFGTVAFTALRYSKFNERISRRLFSQGYDGSGGVTCEWEKGLPVDDSTIPKGLLVASYPASGMRVTWQQIEGMTGILPQDDFFALGEGIEKYGLVKTQYPHFEGIWSYNDNIGKSILLIRNPRWAIPSYHSLLSEIEYAHTWEDAYARLLNVFSARPEDLMNWTMWRDLLFQDEIDQWKWHIDFWMDGGTKYWTDLDFERNGQYPFRFLNETEKVGNIDQNCALNTLDCVASAVISYEKLANATTGPDELTKIANVVRSIPGFTVIDNSHIGCIYHETILNAPEPTNDDRAGLARGDFLFTVEQMRIINETLHEVREKYLQVSSSEATDLTDNLAEYIIEVEEELVELEANPSPTPVPVPDYEIGLVEWYRTLGGGPFGRGDRYAKARVQAMNGYWPLVQHLYPTDAPLSP